MAKIDHRVRALVKNSVSTLTVGGPASTMKLAYVLLALCLWWQQDGVRAIFSIIEFDYLNEPLTLTPVHVMFWGEENKKGVIFLIFCVYRQVYFWSK